MNRRTLLLAAALLASSSFDASAADGVARGATGVGRWIAAQGNQALRDIAEEIREQLLDTLAPVLETPAPSTEPQPQAAAGATADGSAA